jgi:hypothetical protein
VLTSSRLSGENIKPEIAPRWPFIGAPTFRPVRVLQSETVVSSNLATGR